VRELVEYFGQVTVSTLAMRSPGDVVRSLLYEERTNSSEAARLRSSISSAPGS
jgi:hypothetical protein